MVLSSETYLLPVVDPSHSPFTRILSFVTAAVEKKKLNIWKTKKLKHLISQNIKCDQLLSNILKVSKN
jgi:hypothetical protein